MKTHVIIISSLLAIMLTGCGGGSDDEGAASNKLSATVSLYKGSSISQCENGSTSAELDSLVTTLKNTGVTVSSSSCGFDSNRVNIALCGASSNTILIVNVENISPEAVQTYGLHPLSELPGAKSAPCN